MVAAQRPTSLCVETHGLKPNMERPSTPHRVRSPTLITLGRTIRAFREAAGMIQKELAHKLGYTNAWLSNLETAQLRPRLEHITAIEEALGLPGGALVPIFNQLEAEVLPSWFRPWIDEERDASVLRTFQLALIPGLLQTPAYAHAVLGDEALVQARMERQQILNREEPEPPALHCVLDEAVLYQSRGGAEVMREQLEYLITCMSLPRVTIQVIRSEDNPRSLGAFTIATVDGAEVGYIETAIRGIVTSSREDIADLMGTWEEIRTYACSPQESINIIQQAIEDKWT